MAITEARRHNPHRARRLAFHACAVSACLVAVLLLAPLAFGTTLLVPVAHAQSLSGQSTNTIGSPSTGVTATLEECLTASGTGERTTSGERASGERASGERATSERAATFSGQMVAIAGTTRMMMRIDVQERVPGELSFHTLNAPGLGVWRHSASGVKIYKYLKQVTNLPAPATFRALIRFRWLNEKGRVIRRAERRTPTCEQIDPRAKLVVGAIRAIPLRGSSLVDYQVVVRNEGHATASAFGVALTINGIAQPLLNVASVPGGSRMVLESQGPRCAVGSNIEVQLDPKHQIEEAVGGGLAGSVSCPFGEAGASTAAVRDRARG